MNLVLRKDTQMTGERMLNIYRSKLRRNYLNRDNYSVNQSKEKNRYNLIYRLLFGLQVPGTGIEPAHPCGRQILSLLRLPISPPGQNGLQY